MYNAERRRRAGKRIGKGQKNERERNCGGKTSEDDQTAIPARVPNGIAKMSRTGPQRLRLRIAPIGALDCPTAGSAKTRVAEMDKEAQSAEQEENEESPKLSRSSTGMRRKRARVVSS